LNDLAPNILPVKRIVDSPYFAEKNDAFLLQLADACAVTIRYYLEDKSNADEFFDALTDNTLPP
jgi:hypothetical protein